MSNDPSVRRSTRISAVSSRSEISRVTRSQANFLQTENSESRKQPEKDSTPDRGVTACSLECENKNLVTGETTKQTEKKNSRKMVKEERGEEKREAIVKVVKETIQSNLDNKKKELVVVLEESPQKKIEPPGKFNETEQELIVGLLENDNGVDQMETNKTTEDGCSEFELHLSEFDDDDKVSEDNVKSIYSGENSKSELIINDVTIVERSNNNIPKGKEMEGESYRNQEKQPNGNIEDTSVEKLQQNCTEIKVLDRKECVEHENEQVNQNIKVSVNSFDVEVISNLDERSCEPNIITKQTITKCQVATDFQIDTNGEVKEIGTGNRMLENSIESVKGEVELNEKDEEVKKCNESVVTNEKLIASDNSLFNKRTDRDETEVKEVTETTTEIIKLNQGREQAVPMELSDDDDTKTCTLSQEVLFDNTNLNKILTDQLNEEKTRIMSNYSWQYLIDDSSDEDESTCVVKEKNDNDNGNLATKVDNYVCSKLLEMTDKGEATDNKTIKLKIKNGCDEGIKANMLEVDDRDGTNDINKEDRENCFLDTMAEEGDEDSPSENSHEIIEKGEFIGSTDTESNISVEDDYDLNDPFICDSPIQENDNENEESEFSEEVQVSEEEDDDGCTAIADDIIKSPKIIIHENITLNKIQDESFQRNIKELVKKITKYNKQVFINFHIGIKEETGNTIETNRRKRKSMDDCDVSKLEKKKGFISNLPLANRRRSRTQSPLCEDNILKKKKKENNLKVSFDLVDSQGTIWNVTKEKMRPSTSNV